MKLIFTGGHHNSALVVAKQLKQKGYTIHWFGHKHSTQDKQYVSEEYKDVTNAGIQFTQLNSGKIHGGNPKQWFKFIQAIIFCIYQFNQLKPKIVVAFGGYLAVPAVIAARVMRIKAVSHEQTTTMGMANKVMIPFLNKLFLTWKDTTIYSSSSKLKLIGLPIPDETPDGLSTQQLKTWFHKPSKPLIVISGGKQGSHTINMLIKDSLPQLLPQFNILHQVGNNTQFKDLKKLNKIKEQLPLNLQGSYYAIGYTDQFNAILKTASIVIGRSGAHTIYDIIRFHKKMIAIPLPFSYSDEQRKNAAKIVSLGLGEILEQETANASKLVKVVRKINDTSINHQKIDRFIEQHMPLNATKTMIQEIEKLIQS